jgi:hypothetical protein
LEEVKVEKREESRNRRRNRNRSSSFSVNADGGEGNGDTNGGGGVGWGGRTRVVERRRSSVGSVGSAGSKLRNEWGGSSGSGGGEEEEEGGFSFDSGYGGYGGYGGVGDNTGGFEKDGGRRQSDSQRCFWFHPSIVLPEVEGMQDSAMFSVFATLPFSSSTSNSTSWKQQQQQQQQHHQRNHHRHEHLKATTTVATRERVSFWHDIPLVGTASEQETGMVKVGGLGGSLLTPTHPVKPNRGNDHDDGDVNGLVVAAAAGAVAVKGRFEATSASEVRKKRRRETKGNVRDNHMIFVVLMFIKWLIDALSYIKWLSE